LGQFVFETDASLEGLGVVLSQVDEHDKLHPIAEVCPSMNAIMQSLKALVWAVKYFRTNILGHYCVVFTAHSACTSLLIPLLN